VSRAVGHLVLLRRSAEITPVNLSTLLIKFDGYVATSDHRLGALGRNQGDLVR
jgi:hypothetical protein